MISAAAIAIAAATCAMAASSPGQKGTFIPIVPVPNSASTNVFGINDSNIITGSWLDASGVEHGYVGPLSGTKYKTFDDPKSPGPGTEPRAINNHADMGGPPQAPARKSLTVTEILRAGVRRRTRHRETASAESVWDSEGGAAERQAPNPEDGTAPGGSAGSSQRQTGVV